MALVQVSIPPVWKKLGEHLHQDFLLDHPDFNSGIAEFASDLSDEELQELRDFLKHLTENEFAGGVLKRVWAETDGYVGLAPRGNAKWRDIYLEMREVVDAT